MNNCAPGPSAMKVSISPSNDCCTAGRLYNITTWIEGMTSTVKPLARSRERMRCMELGFGYAIEVGRLVGHGNSFQEFKTRPFGGNIDRKSTRLNSSHSQIS